MTVRSAPLARLAGAVIVAVYALGAAWLVWVTMETDSWSGDVTGPAILVSCALFAVFGGVIVSRRPKNPIGWMMAVLALMAGILPGVNGFVEWRLSSGGDATLPLRWGAWLSGWYWYSFLAVLFAFLPLLFPTGTLLSRRWRPVLWAATASVVVMTGFAMVAETFETQELKLVVDNPIGIAGVRNVEESAIGAVSFAVLTIAMLAALASLAIRFFRSRGEERLQLKWFLFALVPLPVSFLFEEQLLGDALFIVAVLGIPTAIGIALMRYRLYEIDRIISRTVSYALVVAILGGLYVGIVVGLGSLLRPLSAENDVTVAVSTLVVAAAFRPVSRRVRAIVDRRFNRSRYDAARTIDAFGARLRDEIDMSELVGDLRRTVYTTMQPAHVSIWTPR